MPQFYRWSSILLVSLALAVCAASASGQTVATFERVYIADANGKEIQHDPGVVHLVDSHGTEIVPPKIEDQKSCHLPRISADRQTAGWQVNVEDC